MLSRLGAHSGAVGCGGAIALATEHVGLLLGPMQRGAGNEIPDTMSGDLSYLLWWRRIITDRLSVIMQMDRDSEQRGAGFAEIFMNFFSTLDKQVASQLSYLFNSTQTMKHFAVSIHVETLSCYCACVSKHTFSSLTDLSCICSLYRGHTGAVVLYMLVFGWQRWMKSWLKYSLLDWGNVWFSDAHSTNRQTDRPLLLSSKTLSNMFCLFENSGAHGA